jgi:hypothetical protein
MSGAAAFVQRRSNAMKVRDFGYVLSIGAAAASLCACGDSTPISPTQTNSNDVVTQSHTFYYTGAKQTFKVPTGVTKLTVVARGAAGAGESGSYSGTAYEYYGRGGRVYAVIPVTSGERLYVYVGGQGSTTGGFNGGANPGIDASESWGYGGGGASDVRRGGDALGDRILIAAGGGGQGLGSYDGFGGKGGPAAGEAGGNSYYGANGGGGGTQSRGGGGGAGGPGSRSGGQAGFSGAPGALGRGGAGGNGGYNPSACEEGYCAGGGGGGGGGGYYGGGGGGGGNSTDYGSAGGNPGAGGGGGASYVEPSATKAQLWRGWKNANGNGLVVFSW